MDHQFIYIFIMIHGLRRLRYNSSDWNCLGMNPKLDPKIPNFQYKVEPPNDG